MSFSLPKTLCDILSRFSCKKGLFGMMPGSVLGKRKVPGCHEEKEDRQNEGVDCQESYKRRDFIVKVECWKYEV